MITRARLMLRIARREALRNRGRSLLVMIMVGLPIAGLVAAAVLVRTTEIAAEQRQTWDFGAADLSVYEDVSQLLPDHVETVAVARRTAHLVAGAERRLIDLRDDALDHPLLAGRLVLLEGQPADSAGEAVISPGLAETSGVGIGDELLLDQPDLVLTVTGFAVKPARLSGDIAVVAPGSLAGAEQTEWLIDAGHEDPHALREKLERQGVQSVWMRDTAAPQSQGEVASAVLLFGGLALFEAVLIAAAAFAVGARRQQRSLGLLAAAGAEQSHLRGVVLAGGVVLGLAGAVTGALVGLGGVFALSPWLDTWLDRLTGGPVVRPADILGAIAVGTAAAVLAAALPARAVSRVPVLAALAGRRPVTTGGRQAALIGCSVVVLGAVVTVLGAADAGGAVWAILAGAILVIVGFSIASTPLLGMLEGVGRRLPTSLRIALRDTVRHRARNGPAIAATMAALSLPIAVSMFALSSDGRAAQRHQPRLDVDQLLLHDNDGEWPVLADVEAVDAIDAAVGLAARSRLWHAAEPGGHGYVEAVGADRPESDIWGLPTYKSTLGIADSAFLEAIGAVEFAGAFEAGYVVALGADTVSGGQVAITRHAGDGAVTDLGTLPAVATGATRTQEVPTFVISSETADILGFDRRPAGWLLRADSELAQAEVAAAREAVALRERVSVDAMQQSMGGSAVMRWLALAVSGLVALAVVAVASALAAAESRTEVATLTAVGASPRTRRGLARARTGLLAGIGGLLAVPAGLLPALAFLIVRGGYPITIPWLAIAVATVALPALAATAAGLMSPSPPSTTLRHG